MKTKHPEDDLQAGCIQWFDSQYNKYSPLLYHIPNGGKRNVREAARLKKQGVRAGIPDLFLAMANSKHYGLYIEMKALKGVLTDKQKYYIPILQGENYRVEVCRSLDEFMSVINEYVKDYEK